MRSGKMVIIQWSRDMASSRIFRVFLQVEIATMDMKNESVELCVTPM